MRRNLVPCVALVAFVALSLGFPLGEAEAATPPSSPENVSYCDRTSSVITPYVLVTSPVDSIVAEGHGSHTGPVYPAVGPDGNWGDIIPPFDYDNGQQHFAGVDWPEGSDVLRAGCAVHATIDSPPVAAAAAVTKPNIVVNVSCRATMNLDVTYNEEPPTPWTLIVFIDGVEQFILPDNDGDLRGFHPKIPAYQLPQVSYTYSVNATNAGQNFAGIASGNVVCQTPPTTTTTAPTTTTKPPTTTTAPTTTTKPPTTTTAPTTTTKPPTTTTAPTTTTKPATSTTSPTTAVTTTSGPSTPTTATTPGQTTTTAASASGSTTTTSVPTSGTPPPTAAPTPLDPPPVEALEPGEVLSDPPPHVLVFVVVPGNRVVVLGALRPEQVRTLFRELAQRRFPRTGNDSGAIVLVASLALLSGGALIGLTRRPRRRPA
jgi:hypothetical protein